MGEMDINMLPSKQRYGYVSRTTKVPLFTEAQQKPKFFFTGIAATCNVSKHKKVVMVSTRKHIELLYCPYFYNQRINKPQFVFLQ